MVKITEVALGSCAYKANVKAGDILVSINGNEIKDVLDYSMGIDDLPKENVLKYTKST